MNIAEHIKDPHVIAAFNDMARRGAAEFVLRDDDNKAAISKMTLSEDNGASGNLHCGGRAFY